jgi:lipopolysaccharide heptosyltransferase II
VLLSTPVIKAVRDAYPKSYIAFMARPYARDIVEGNPCLDEVIIHDKDGGIFKIFSFVCDLRKKKFDIALVLHPTRRTHLIIFLAGIPERIGYDKKWGFLLTKRLPHFKQFGLKHEIDYTLDIIKLMGVESKDHTLYMPIKTGSEIKIKKLFDDNGIKERDPVIAINPGASCPSKKWPPENFSRVCDELAKRYSAKIVVISDINDKPFAAKVVLGMAKPAVDLSGKTSVSDLASVLKRARLFISNDSGPVHIACAVGTPVIAIFGRSDRGLSPERWGPSGGRDIVLHKYVGCKECYAHECKNGFKCLDAVTPDDVIEAAAKILG